MIDSIINRIRYKMLPRDEFLNKVRYNRDGFYRHSARYQPKREKVKITVVVPVFNAEKTLRKTVESILNQSLGAQSVEILLVDDASSDSSRSIILDYAERNPNIIPVFLKGNTGSPSAPRNLGIQLAKGKYITFIDSDDWFHEDGLKSLYDLLEQSGCPYAIGKTIKVTEKGQYLVGEYNHWSTREKIRPSDIRDIFYHLGPTARMMRTDFLREHSITFPPLRFAEDKHFFIDVLTKCEFISTSKDVVYYANRYSDNESFTTTTSIFEKTDTNIALIHYVKKKNLPIELETLMLNRVFEFDCITRLFNRAHFLKSDEKEKYYEKFSLVLEAAKDLRYDFTDYFHEDWHRVLVEFFKAGRYDDMIELIKWNRYTPVKDYRIINGIPYFTLPFEPPYHLAQIGCFAEHIQSIKGKDSFTIQFKIYKEDTDRIQTLAFRERNQDLNQLEFPIEEKDGYYEVNLDKNDLSKFERKNYAVFIKYNDYMKIHIRMNVREIIQEEEKQFDFYVTRLDNFSVAVK